jgi:peptidoglycan L-alanyl-D-glutamate endopeptidase CwlK
MKKFTLSKRSRNNLVGVNDKLVQVVELAIQLTDVDFAVTEGVRTLARQRQLVAQGASKTLNSKHITGHAVDLVAFLGSRVSWELKLYDEIADAMASAAREHGVAIRWGGAWNVPDIRNWNGDMESAMVHYVDTRRREGKRPFIDAPHFEMV